MTITEVPRTPTATDEPFEIALRSLMEERELSIRGLAKLTQERDPAPLGEWSQLAAVRPHGHREQLERRPGLGHPFLARLLRGEGNVSPRLIEIVAHALAIEPRFFAEYRLDVARERLEWRAPDQRTRHRQLALALRELAEVR